MFQQLTTKGKYQCKNQLAATQQHKRLIVRPSTIQFWSLLLNWWDSLPRMKLAKSQSCRLATDSCLNKVTQNSQLQCCNKNHSCIIVVALTLNLAVLKLEAWHLAQMDTSLQHTTNLVTHYEPVWRHCLKQWESTIPAYLAIYCCCSQWCSCHCSQASTCYNHGSQATWVDFHACPHTQLILSTYVLSALNFTCTW